MGRRRRIPSTVRLPRRWRRGGWGLLAFVLVALAVAWDRSAHPPGPSHDQLRYHDKTFRVVHVVDGDTFDVDIADGDKSYTRVRLWGVDTPEISHGAGTSMYFGEQAKAFTEQALGGGQAHLILSPTQSRDRYKRLLAYAYLSADGPMLNEMLLEQGYAYADWRFEHPNKDHFAALDRRAQADHVGLWAGVSREKMPKWRQREGHGK